MKTGRRDLYKSMTKIPSKCRSANIVRDHAMILLDDATPKPDGIFGKDRGAGDGGSNRTSGDVAVVGSHDLSARTAGGSAGLDYRLAPARSWASRDSIFSAPV